MSDIGETTEVVDVTDVTDTTPEDAAPIVDGQAVEGNEGQEDDVFDVSQYSTKMVDVKVDGEVVRVPLSEALSGYQRQADYTRKTQELSRATALQQALEANPQATLQLLQQTYGVEAGNQMAYAAQAEEQDDGIDPSDPVARQMSALRAQVDELTSYRTEQVLNDTLAGLQAKYGEHFNEQELIQAAAMRQISSPAELESVFRDLAFDKLFATAQATEQHASQQAVEKAAREAAKSGLSGIVSSGNGVSQGAATPPVERIDSFEAAFEAARKQVGV